VEHIGSYRSYEKYEFTFATLQSASTSSKQIMSVTLSTEPNKAFHK
jgi:hypothetical protein